MHTHRCSIAFGTAWLVAAASAQAQTPSGTASAASTPVSRSTFSEQLVLDSGRLPYGPAPHEMHAEVHGEYQLRYANHSDLSLAAPPGAPDATSLGQQNAVTHWLRVTPRFYFSKRVFLVGQLDYPSGFFLGEETRFVTAAENSMSERAPFRADPRWLYLDIAASYGHWRIGHQGVHWGFGLLANDGNRASLFGDYRRGSIVERILFATNPAGDRSKLSLAFAADCIFRDNFAKLTDRDYAFQGVAMLVYGTEQNQVGLYGATREQTRGEGDTLPTAPYTDRLSLRIADLSGKFNARVPGAPGYVFGQAEALVQAGTTRFVQNPAQNAAPLKSSVRAWGGALTLGTVHETHRGSERWGDLVVSVEWGYASGDNNPFDAAQTRLAFDPNHKVGLVLFDQVMHWTTARAAVNGDLALRGSPSSGLQYLPTNGAVAGATYLYPTVVIRPAPWLDLKGAVLIAQATADLADPYLTLTKAKRSNYNGGDPSRRDLGVELDFGVETRIPMEYGVKLQLGAQAGVLFPGRAFDDATGNGLKTQYLAMGRFGIQY